MPASKRDQSGLTERSFVWTYSISLAERRQDRNYSCEYVSKRKNVTHESAIYLALGETDRKEGEKKRRNFKALSFVNQLSEIKDKKEKETENTSGMHYML